MLKPAEKTQTATCAAGESEEDEWFLKPPILNLIIEQLSDLSGDRGVRRSIAAVVADENLRRAGHA